MLKRITLLIALGVLLIAVAGVQADSAEDAILCGGLAEADCAIKKSNSAVMDELQAFAMALSMRMDIEAADPADNTSIILEGAGSAALDPALMEAASALESAEGMAPAAMMALLNELFGGLAAEMSLALTAVEAGESSEMPLHLLMKDGVVALNMAAFADESDESDEAVAGWLGIDLADILDSAGTEEDMTGFKMAGMDHSALARAMTIVRLPDSELNGLPVAVFQTSLELGALLDSIGAMELAGAMSADADDMEALGDAWAQVVEYISLADSYTRRLEVAMATMDDVTGEAAPMSLSMNMRLDLSEFNQPVDVALPEDVFVMPLAMMQQMNQ